MRETSYYYIVHCDVRAATPPILSAPSDTDCSNIEGVCPLSCENDDLSCFLVDNNGFILLSKERNDVSLTRHADLVVNFN
ncbi:hypothetical protein AMECASPLE_030841, partial [Ameca splendens]